MSAFNINVQASINRLMMGIEGTGLKSPQIEGK